MRRHKKRRHNLSSSVKTPAFLILIAGLIGSGAFLLWVASFNLPDLQSFEERKVDESTKIYDRTGTVLLLDVHQNVRRTIVPFEHISVYMKNATVAIEDAEFYRHGGIKPTSILRAVFVNIARLQYSQGGSTITQQVIKNALLTSEKSIARKLKEWILAIKLDRLMSKDQILGLYLNETPYGGNIYGVEEASKSFFGISADKLSLAQAAHLAALPQAPTYYSPYGNHKQELEQRKNLVLSKMLKGGFISEQEYESARAEKVAFLPRSDKSILAPHFVTYIKEYLEKKYGQEAMDGGGLSVITTLDYKLQTQAEEIVKRYALENKKKFNAENAALAAIDPQTGQILVMVGSRDYFDKDIDGNFNVTLAHRQPGSAFKPFIYATAFKKGYTPETVVFDVETEFSTACTPDSKPRSRDAVCYNPQNYDNTFRGPLSLRNALAQSINIPAVKMFYLAGLPDSLRTARDLGITSLGEIGRYGLTLVLGGGEVSPLEMASAYGVFANEGVRNPPIPILSIKDKGGATLEEFTPHPIPALPQDIALQISDILSDNTARIPSYGEHSPLYFPGRDVAAKTGTTNDSRDAWIIGYAPNIAVGAWAGNNDNSPMEKKVAGLIVAPMWNAFMQKALASLPKAYFSKPIERDMSALKPVLRGVWQGGKTVIIDKVTGASATEATAAQEERITTDVHSILYWLNKDDPLGPAPEHPENDPQFASWEFAVRAWAARNPLLETIVVPVKRRQPAPGASNFQVDAASSATTSTHNER